MGYWPNYGTSPKTTKFVIAFRYPIMSKNKSNLKNLFDLYGGGGEFLGLLAGLFLNGVSIYKQIQEGHQWYILAFLIGLAIALGYLFIRWLRKFIIKRKIKSFYEAIRIGIPTRDFSKAWNLLSQEFKNDRWDNDINRFKKGFKFTQNVELLKIVSNGYKHLSHSYIVLYKDSMSAPEIKGLEQLDGVSLGEVEKIKDFALATYQDLKNASHDAEKFNALEAKLVFRKNFSDIVRWTLNVDNLPNVQSDNPEKYYLSAKLVRIKRRKPIIGTYEITNITDINDIMDT